MYFGTKSTLRLLTHLTNTCTDGSQMERQTLPIIVLTDTSQMGRETECVSMRTQSTLESNRHGHMLRSLSRVEDLPQFLRSSSRSSQETVLSFTCQWSLKLRLQCLLVQEQVQSTQLSSEDSLQRNLQTELMTASQSLSLLQVVVLSQTRI